MYRTCDRVLASVMHDSLGYQRVNDLSGKECALIVKSWLRRAELHTRVQ